MTNLDQFESVFRAADKEPFEPETITIDSVAVVCDLDDDDRASFLADIQGLIGHLPVDLPTQWHVVADFGSVADLVEQLKQINPDLICTYRNLKIPATDFPYSLGVFVDVMTQATAHPILLLPHPKVGTSWPEKTRNVLAMTDHLAGDHHLVSFAARMTASDGKLILAHLEDEGELERYLETISRIPTIDTDDARIGLAHQLLKEPTDFIGSCRDWLKTHRSDLEIDQEVSIGHRLADCRRLIAEYQVEMIVMNTKDDEQLAMHGLAYPLAVELRETPLMLL